MHRIDSVGDNKGTSLSNVPGICFWKIKKVFTEMSGRAVTHLHYPASHVKLILVVYFVVPTICLRIEISLLKHD